MAQNGRKSKWHILTNVLGKYSEPLIQLNKVQKFLNDENRLES